MLDLDVRPVVPAPGLAPGHPQVDPEVVRQLCGHHIRRGLRPIVWLRLPQFLPPVIPRGDRQTVPVGVPDLLLLESNLLPHGGRTYLCLVSPIPKNIERILPWDEFPAKAVSDAYLSACSLAGGLDDSS